MIRDILIVLLVAIFGIISLPIYFVLFIVGKFDMRKKMAISQKIVAFVLKMILFVSGVKLDVRGIDNIPRDEAVMFIANHRSYFDIIATYATLPILTSYISKDGLKKFPVVSNWMKRLNCLFLERDNPRQGLEVILKAIGMVKDGISIFVMPEGTRNHGQELLAFHDATFKIATKSGCKVVPVAMIGTDDIFENNKYRVKSGKIILQYGKPVDLADIPKEEKKHPGELFRGIIEDMLKEMK